MQTEIVQGTTPTGGKPRVLEVWLKEIDGQTGLHLWIHAPGAGNIDGWEVRVDPAEFQAALAKLGLGHTS